MLYYYFSMNINKTTGYDLDCRIHNKKFYVLNVTTKVKDICHICKMENK